MKVPLYLSILLTKYAKGPAFYICWFSKCHSTDTEQLVESLEVSGRTRYIMSTSYITKLNCRASFFPYLKTGLGFTQELIHASDNGLKESWQPSFALEQCNL